MDKSIESRRERRHSEIQPADDPAGLRLPPRFVAVIEALQAIVAGSRDRTLADAPDLDPTMSAEILFLIETLETPQ